MILFAQFKATSILESLLDFSIEVHGHHLPHVKFLCRRVQWINETNYFKSNELIREALAVLELSPNTQLVPHEPVARALCMYNLCFTNQ